MSVLVMIYGQSGTGKSTSLRNFSREDVAIVNVSGKPFEAFRDPASGKTFTPAEVFQMAKKRNADGVARCADCRKKKGEIGRASCRERV